jgi:hypothetical protein
MKAKLIIALILSLALLGVCWYFHNPEEADKTAQQTTSQVAAAPGEAKQAAVSWIKEGNHWLILAGAGAVVIFVGILMIGGKKSGDKKK